MYNTAALLARDTLVFPNPLALDTQAGAVAAVGPPPQRPARRETLKIAHRWAGLKARDAALRERVSTKPIFRNGSNTHVLQVLETTVTPIATPPLYHRRRGPSLISARLHIDASPISHV